MQPPAISMQPAGRRRRQPQRAQSIGEPPSDHGPHLESRPVGGDPQSFVQEAGNSDTEQPAKEDHVIVPVGIAIVFIGATVGPQVVELRRLLAPPANRHHAKAHQEPQAHDVENSGVHLVESSLPELQRRTDRLEHVVVHRDHHRTRGRGRQIPRRSANGRFQRSCLASSRSSAPPWCGRIGWCAARRRSSNRLAGRSGTFLP